MEGLSFFTPKFGPATPGAERFAPAASLPAFGRLCEKASRLAGAKPLALASRSQRLWIEAARAALAAMGENGADVAWIEFQAPEERAVLRRLSDAISLTGDEGHRPPKDSPLASARCFFDAKIVWEGRPQHGQVLRLGHGRRERPTREFWQEGGRLARRDETLRGVIFARAATESGRGFMRSLVRSFSSEAGARAFIVGHEAGHALSVKRGADWIVEALANARAGAGLEIRARELLRECERWAQAWVAFGVEPPSEGARTTISWLEESFCDAVGCWAAESAGHKGAAEAALAWRERGTNESREKYKTGWILRRLAEKESLGLMRFEALGPLLAQWAAEELSSSFGRAAVDRAARADADAAERRAWAQAMRRALARP
jgi:hypothetical protein